MPKGKGNVRTFYRSEYQKFLNGLVGRIFSENLSDAQIAAEVGKGFIPNKDDPYGTHGIEHKGVKLDDVVRNARNLNACLNDERNHATHTYFHRVLLCIVCHPCSR